MAFSETQERCSWMLGYGGAEILANLIKNVMKNGIRGS